MKKWLSLCLLLLPGIAHAQGFCPNFATAAHVITAANLPYTLGGTDYCNLLVVNSPTPGVVLLPTPGTGNTPAGYTMSIKNDGSAQMTLATVQNPLTFYTPLIDMGQATANTPVLPVGGSVVLYNNGMDWFSVGFNAGTGPIYVSTLTFGAPGANAPALGVNINGLLSYTANGVTQNIGLYTQGSGLNLSTVSFKQAGFVAPAICSVAPLGAHGNGAPEWLTVVDPLGNVKSIPLC